MAGPCWRGPHCAKGTRCTSVPRPRDGRTRVPGLGGAGGAGEASAAGAQRRRRAGVACRGLGDDAPRQLVERRPGPGGREVAGSASASASRRGCSSLRPCTVIAGWLVAKRSRRSAARRSPCAASRSVNTAIAASSDSGRPIASASSSDSRSAWRAAARSSWRDRDLHHQQSDPGLGRPVAGRQRQLQRARRVAARGVELRRA